MEQFTIQDILTATGGALRGEISLDVPISDVVIDSRQIKPGVLFVPVIGENFDGHDFISQSFDNGAIVSLSDHELDETRPYILVSNTLEAFQSIAGAYRSLFSIPFVGVTGSVGKTTTKELIASVLSQRYNTLKNLGNLNNQLGVPRTLLRLDSSHEAAIIEMGTNHFGEIESLSKIVRPDVCVFTNIGDAHIEFFGSREGILKAKCEMLEYRSADAPIIVNGDDPLLCALRDEYPNVISYGSDCACDVYAADIEELGLEGSNFTAHFGGQSLRVTVPAPGSFMVQRALCAVAVGLALEVPPKKIAEGISLYAPVSGRMTIEKTDRYTLLNDAYNASPTSVAASIDVAAKAEGRHVLILGDMFELGKDELHYHQEIGAYAAGKRADLILCVGKLSKAICEGAQSVGGNAIHYKDKKSLLAALPELLQPGDTILIKASNGMKLQDVADYIKDNL